MQPNLLAIPSATITEERQVGGRKLRHGSREGKREERKREARNRNASKDRAERRRNQEAREKRARTIGWHCSRWGPTLTLAFTPNQSILYRRAPVFVLSTMSARGRENIPRYRRMHESSIQSHTRREREKGRKIHRAQNDCVHYATWHSSPVRSSASSSRRGARALTEFTNRGNTRRRREPEIYFQ